MILSVLDSHGRQKIKTRHLLLLVLVQLLDEQ